MLEDTKRFQWNESRIWLDLYRLLAYFYSSNTLYRLRDPEGYEYDSIKNLRDECEKAEIHELLLKIAASYRTQQDSVPGWNGRTGPTNVNPWHNACGTLWPNAEQEEHEPLQLRVACNKILHADALKHDYHEFTDIWNYALAPRLQLSGDMNGTRWKAVLEIPAFVDCLFYNYGEA